MSALTAQSTVALSPASVFGMKRLADREKLCPTAELLSKNQNAIGRRRSKSEDMPSGGTDDSQIRNASLPPSNYALGSHPEFRVTSSTKQEKTGSHRSQDPVTITQRSSKPSRNESVTVSTAHSRKRQRDRHATYESRLKQAQLYSLFVSSSGVECYDSDCEPSVFKASHRCGTLPMDHALEHKWSREDSELRQMSPLMTAQHLKANSSYASLTNLSNMIDHEPNVSRIDSRTRSISNLLLHKPSLFLTSVFNKMTHEQRSKSMAELSRLHEALTKSRSKINIANLNTEDKLPRAASLPDLDKKASRVQSVTSFDLSSSPERSAARETNENPSVISNEQQNADRFDFEKKKDLTEPMISDHTHLITSSKGEQMIGASQEINSAIDQTTGKSGMPNLAESSQQEFPNSININSEKIASVPVFDQHPVRKLSQENLQTVSNSSVTMSKHAESSPLKIQPTPKSSSILVKSNKSNTNIAIGRIKPTRSAHFVDTHLHEEFISSKSKSDIPNKLALMTSANVVSSLNTRVDPTSTTEEPQQDKKSESMPTIKKRENTVHKAPNQDDQQVSSHASDSLKTEAQNEQTKLAVNDPVLKAQVSGRDNPRSSPKSASLENEQMLSSSVTNDEKPSTKSPQMAEQKSKEQQELSNDKAEEIGNSLDDVSSYLSQQRAGLLNPTIKASNHSLQGTERPYESMTTASPRTKKLIPLAKIDETSQHSELSINSDLVQSISSGSKEYISPKASNGKEVLDLDNDAPLSEPQTLQNYTIDDDNASISTRTTTNLAISDDDDEQSKLVNERLKRSSLGLARDSLELLRNAVSSIPTQVSSDERLIPRTSIDSTPRKRKSVLKSRLDSSDDLPAPELISYVAIDELKGDKRSVEKQMKRRSLTVGGGTVISCTSPKPKRDSLLLLQERFSGTISPETGVHHLSGSDSKHVEFIREPGDTVTPALNIGRGSKMKHSHNKPWSPSSSSNQLVLYPHQEPNTLSTHSLDSSERPKSETSLTGKQRFDVGVGSHRRHSADYASRHRSFSPRPQTSSTAASVVDANSADSTEEEKVCLCKSDYDEMVRLIMTPLSRHRKCASTRHSLESDLELRINRRLNSLLSLIITFLLILFYIFVFIKSELWHRYWHYPSVHSDENDDEDGYY